MILGTRDTRQRLGYSRDIFIPIAARDANARFWGWRRAFTPPTSGAKGNFLERRIDLQVTPVARLDQSGERGETLLLCGARRIPPELR